MIIRNAKEEDISKICIILDETIQYFKDKKINQWQDGIPNKEILLEDIKKDALFLVENNNEIIAFSAFYKADIKRYIELDNLKTNSSSIKRFAVSKNYFGTGIASEFINFYILKSIDLGFDSIILDTHEENIPMRNLLEKFCFNYSGKLSKVDRIAYVLDLERR